jgi:hypothetical protein
MLDTILWRRLDGLGHEAASLTIGEDAAVLRGTAVFSHERLSCHLSYEVRCSAGFRTEGASVRGWIGSTPVDLEISVDRQTGGWFRDGSEVAGAAGCTDIDLNFSPSTNLLPIRRLKLEVGEQRAVRAAWLRFPSLELEPLEQIYTRLSGTTWRYESGGGSFVTELEVDSRGFVVRYPKGWEAVP